MCLVATLRVPHPFSLKGCLLCCDCPRAWWSWLCVISYGCWVPPDWSTLLLEPFAWTLTRFLKRTPTKILLLYVLQPPSPSTFSHFKPSLVEPSRPFASAGFNSDGSGHCLENCYKYSEAGGRVPTGNVPCPRPSQENQASLPSLNSAPCFISESLAPQPYWFCNCNTGAQSRRPASSKEQAVPSHRARYLLGGLRDMDNVSLHRQVSSPSAFFVSNVDALQEPTECKVHLLRQVSDLGPG